MNTGTVTPNPTTLHCFVISLPSAGERRKRLLPALGDEVSVTVVDAIDGRSLGYAGLSRWCPRPFSGRLMRRMMPSEIACTVSHGCALEAFLQGNASHALVLEDDAKIQPDTIAKVIALLNAFPALDLVKLGGWGAETAPGRLVGDVEGMAVIAVTTFGVGTHGYVLSRTGARRLLPTLYPVTEPYDIFLRSVQRHRCSLYEVAPHPIGLDETAATSTIGVRPVSRPKRHAVDLVSILSAKLKHNLGPPVFNARRFGLGAVTGRGLRRWPTT